MQKKFMKKLFISKNKFYSILALNTIIEKNLETNEEKNIKYFNIIDRSKFLIKKRYY